MNTLHTLSPVLLGYESIPAVSQRPPQGSGIPPQLTEIYDRHVAALTAKVAAGHIFDGPVAVLRGWHTSEKQLHLEIQPSTYVPMTATRLTYVEALSSGILSEADIPSIPELFGACLCACVAVITHDNQVLTMRRAVTMSNPGTVALGLGEVLECSDFEAGSQSLQAAGARAVREELGVRLTPEQASQFVRPLVLARGDACGTWVFIIAVDLREAGESFRASRILANAQSATDAWESDLRQAIPFTRPSLESFLQDNEGRLGHWAPELVPLLISELG